MNRVLYKWFRKNSNSNLLWRKVKDRLFRSFCLLMVLFAFLFMVGFFTSIALDACNSFWSYKLQINALHKRASLDESFLSLYLATSLPEKDFSYTYQQVFSNRADEEFEQQKNNTGSMEITLSSKTYQLLDQGLSSDHIVTNFIEKVQGQNLIRKEFTFAILTNKESRDPEFAGVLTSSIGSLISILIALLTSLPLALFSAIYLEEMVSASSKFTGLIKTNIANLASVPSIVYGIVGYAVYIEYFDLPRSSSLVGGLTLMLMTIPNLIITYSTALKTVPVNIKNAAIALGLTKQQVIFHHIVPYCIPGFVTGTIMVLARIFGETAPLLMIGMAAFVVDLPSSVLDPATVLPMQIYLWADSPEFEFVIKSSGAIIVLLLILMIIGIIALKIRNKYTIKW